MIQKTESNIKLEIVGLRKLGSSLTEISEKKSVSVPVVRSILKKELGDDYDKYKYRSIAAISQFRKNKVVELWKQRNSLRKVSCLAKFSIVKVKAILSEELEKSFDKYSRKLTYEEIKQLAPIEKLTYIVELKERGKNIYEISDISKFPIKFIKKYLKLKIGQIEASPPKDIKIH